MSERELSVQAEHDTTARGASFEVSSSEGGVIVAPTGDLDLDSRESLREVLAPLAGVVVVDLARVTFLDSSAIGVLVGVRNGLHDGGGELRLRNPQEFVLRTLTTIGVADWIVD